MKPTETFLELPEAYYRQVARYIWPIAGFLAVAFGLSASLWPEYALPLIAVPIVGAASVGGALGWIGAGRNREEIVRSFSSNFWLKLNPQEERDLNTIDLFEEMTPDLNDRRKVYRIRTLKGDVYVLHAQRFVELLVSKSLDDVEKATEHAMALAWKRCCGELRPDLEPLVSKTFRAVFTEDFGGNMVQLISKVGGAVIEELRERVDEVENPETPFELEALPPSTRKGRRRSGRK